MFKSSEKKFIDFVFFPHSYLSTRKRFENRVWLCFFYTFFSQNLLYRNLSIHFTRNLMIALCWGTPKNLLKGEVESSPRNRNSIENPQTMENVVYYSIVFWWNLIPEELGFSPISSPLQVCFGSFVQIFNHTFFQ